jgi:hypothetical protein
MSDNEEEYHYSDDEYVYSDNEAVSPPKSTTRSATQATPKAATSASSAPSAAGAGVVFGGGVTAASRAGQLSKAKTVASSSSSADYVLLLPEEIEREQRKAIGEIHSVLDIPAECANTLLIHFKYVVRPRAQYVLSTQLSTALHCRWNKERLFEKYMADPKRVQIEAGVRATAQ